MVKCKGDNIPYNKVWVILTSEEICNYERKLDAFREKVAHCRREAAHTTVRLEYLQKKQAELEAELVTLMNSNNTVLIGVQEQHKKTYRQLKQTEMQLHHSQCELVAYKKMNNCFTPSYVDAFMQTNEESESMGLDANIIELLKNSVFTPFYIGFNTNIVELMAANEAHRVPNTKISGELSLGKTDVQVQMPPTDQDREQRNVNSDARSSVQRDRNAECRQHKAVVLKL
ncbi:hypothetical protein Moror_14384, partial [Moniliophthora roreri MCA 2997]